MSFVKYLCIDDQPEQYIKPMLDRLAGTNGDLSFHRMQPRKLEEQLAYVKDLERASEVFGLLLDLRLDEEFDENGEKVFYRGPTLAQELRSRMSDGEICSFPIVLWSMNDKIVHSYSPDSSSHDLFDAVYAKDDGQYQLEDGCVSSELVSLARGYQSLRGLLKKGGVKVSGAVEILDLQSSERELLDPRLMSCFHNVSVFSAAARVLSLLKTDGVLIGEGLLAAKLGVDILNSGKYWGVLKEHLKGSKYGGVFSDGWERWWAHRVDSFGLEVLQLKTSLRRLDARDRVAALNEKLGIGLIPAEPICTQYSTKYTTVCFATKRPLDSSDGFKILSHEQDSWHDSRYVSAYAVLERINKDTWHLDPLELERYKGLKEKLKNEQKN